MALLATRPTWSVETGDPKQPVPNLGHICSPWHILTPERLGLAPHAGKGKRPVSPNSVRPPEPPSQAHVRSATKRGCLLLHRTEILWLIHCRCTPRQVTVTSSVWNSAFGSPRPLLPPRSTAICKMLAFYSAALGRGGRRELYSQSKGTLAVQTSAFWGSVGPRGPERARGS